MEATRRLRSVEILGETERTHEREKRQEKGKWQQERPKHTLGWGWRFQKSICQEKGACVCVCVCGGADRLA